MRKYPYGQNFNQYAKSAFTSDISPHYDPVKSAQLYAALEGKTEFNETSATEVTPAQTLEVTQDTLNSLTELPEMVEKLRPFLGKTVEISRDETGQIQYREVTE